MKLTLDLAEDTPDFDTQIDLTDTVEAAVNATLLHEGIDGDISVSVTFTDNEGIRELNRRYREIDRPTDVLSFPMYSFDGDDVPDFSEETVLLGDIVISVEKAKEQAEEYGHSLKREISFLSVHSTLHLLGYDHVTGVEDEKRMFAIQNLIMDELGITRDDKD